MSRAAHRSTAECVDDIPVVLMSCQRARHDWAALLNKNGKPGAEYRSVTEAIGIGSRIDGEWFENRTADAYRAEASDLADRRRRRSKTNRTPEKAAKRGAVPPCALSLENTHVGLRTGGASCLAPPQLILQ
jgi:hypothetical protein